jgi:uncharacterized protein
VRVRCPVCNRFFDPKESSTLPFCTERCRLVDLGRWLGEAYGLPYEREEEANFDRPDEDQE